MPKPISGKANAKNYSTPAPKSTTQLASASDALETSGKTSNETFGDHGTPFDITDMAPSGPRELGPKMTMRGFGAAVRGKQYTIS